MKSIAPAALAIISAISLLVGGCKQHGPPMVDEAQLDLPVLRCDVQVIGAAQVIVTFDQTAPTVVATRAALKARAKGLTPCDATLVQRDGGVELILPGLTKDDRAGLESLASTGVVWVAPWYGAAPKRGDAVKRVEKAVSLSVTEALLTYGQDDRAAVALTLDAASAKRLHELTKRYVDNHILLAVDGQALMAPRVREPIAEGRILVDMGAGERASLEREARMLVRAVRGPVLPQPVSVGAIKYIAPATP